MKQCRKCKEVKSLTAFSKNKNFKDGLQTNCKLCVISYNTLYYKDNKEKCNKNSTRWNQSNKVKRNLSIKKWADNNRDKISQTTLNWQKNNPEKHCINQAKRRAKKLQRTPNWLTPLHLDNIKLFYEASSRLTKELGILFVVDHIIPLQGKNVSGLHVPWNLQVITDSENSKKNNKV